MERKRGLIDSRILVVVLFILCIIIFLGFSPLYIYIGKEALIIALAITLIIGFVLYGIIIKQNV